MKTNTITIVGMDRIGASIGLALKDSVVEARIIGHDSRDYLLKAADDLKAVDEAIPNLSKAVAGADIVVLAMPAFELQATLQIIGSKLQAHTLVIDLSLLKSQGAKWAEKYLQNGFYVGARAIFSTAIFAAGCLDTREARADLFVNSVFCVMPGSQTDPQAVETAVNFGRLLGSQPYFVDPMEFDGLVNSVETTPGLAAAALFGAIHKSTGWRDILRFADLPFAVTTSALELQADDLALLAMSDKISTLRWLDAMSAELKEIRRWISEGNEETLGALLAQRTLDRERWLRERERNDWVEGTDSAPPGQRFSEHFMGSLISRKRDE